MSISPTAPGEHPLVSFGDISMTEHWLVTPQATLPLAGTQIIVTDQTRVERFTPAWAIVLAVIGFFFFFLGLLFLLVRENRVTGFMQITVVNGSFTYQSAERAAFDPGAQLFELQTRANYARGLIARATPDASLSRG